MQNKKAISDLIATVLMVLVTIGVLGLIVAAVYPMIQNGITESSAKKECLNVALSIKDATLLATTLTVNVERGESQVNLSKVLVKMVDNTGASTTFACATVPQIFSNVLCKNTDPANVNITEVDVLPFIKVGDAEIACSGTGRVAVK
jgi:predicted PurR-regulated permease PerM